MKNTLIFLFAFSYNFIYNNDYLIYFSHLVIIKVVKSKDKLIYNSWVKLFWKFWVKRVSVDMIVEEAGVAKWTFYIYYKNKQELYEKIIDDILDSWKNYVANLHDKIPDIKERFFYHMVWVIWFFEKNIIIKNIVEWNKDYFDWKININYLFLQHVEVMKILFWNEFDDKKLKDISNIKRLYFEILNYKKCFLNKKDYKQFILDFAAIITNWIFSDYKSIQKWRSYLDLQKI